MRSGVVFTSLETIVIVLVCLGSSFVGLCHRVLVCDRQYTYLVFCRIMIVCNEVTYSLADFTDLYSDITKKGAYCPYSHGHDCFQVHFVQIDFHGKPLTNGVGAHIFV